MLYQCSASYGEDSESYRVCSKTALKKNEMVFGRWLGMEEPLLEDINKAAIRFFANVILIEQLENLALSERLDGKKERGEEIINDLK